MFNGTYIRPLLVEQNPYLTKKYDFYYQRDKLQHVPKKMSFSGKTAITTFKLIQNAKFGGVLENSGYLLQNGH